MASCTHWSYGTCPICARARILAIDENIKRLQGERNGLLYELGEIPFE